MRRTDHRMAPPWVSAPGRIAPPLATDEPAPATTSSLPVMDTGWPPHERPNPPPRDLPWPEPAVRGPAPHAWSTGPSGRGPQFDESSARPRDWPGTQGQEPVRSYPRGRFIGVVVVAATVAAVIGALGLPLAGPSPSGEPTVIAPGRSAAVDTSTDPSIGSASEPDPVPPTAAPARPPGGGTTPGGSAPAESAGSGPERSSRPPSGSGTAGSERISGTSPGTSDPSTGGTRRAGSAEDSEKPGGDRTAGRAVLATRAVDRLGPVVVDGKGFTLYRFDGDTGGAATCTDACTSTWLPVIVDPNSPLDAAGVQPADVGLVRRPDGAVQLTLGGWPVYRFAGDLRPGRGSGHGIGGVWFAVAPTGKKADAP